jgi:hypothetical protein
LKNAILWRVSLADIRIIKTGINVSKIKAQLEKYNDDWGVQKRIDGADQIDPDFHRIEAGVLQLVMGAITKPGEMAYNTEICIKTPAFDRHTEIVRFLKRNFKSFSRCGFLSLPVGEIVGTHIDQGTYYLNKDRYHLSIQGRYEYHCGDDVVNVEPGTLLWFDNKKPHGAKNIGDVTRITFVFDVPHHKSNP